MMNKELKQFLKDIIGLQLYDFEDNPYSELEELKQQAQNFLDDDFKEEITQEFDFMLRYHSDEMEYFIKNQDIVNFISITSYSEDSRNYINQNYLRMDEITNCLLEIIEERKHPEQTTIDEFITKD